MKILLIDGIYPINTRNKRIIFTLKKKYNIFFCAWNRGNLSVDNDNNFVYSSNEGYGNKIKKIKGMKNYLEYIKKINEEEDPKILIASQWDMLLLCYLVKKKNQILIYDNIDMPSATNKFMFSILRLLEKFLINKVDGIVHASRFFLQEYNFFEKEQIVLENTPLKDLTKNIVKKAIEEEKIKIAFIGTVRYLKNLEEMAYVLKKYPEYIEMLIFGSGPDEDKFKLFVKNKGIDNIIFFGKYAYEEIGEIYEKIDLVWAVYPSDDYNVKYAISNKFFESLIYEKPCFFAKETLLGEFVDKNNLGFTVKCSSMNELDEKFSLLSKFKEEIEIKKNNIKRYKKENIKLFWEENEIRLIEFIEKIIFTI